MVGVGQKTALGAEIFCVIGQHGPRVVGLSADLLVNRMGKGGHHESRIHLFGYAGRCWLFATPPEASCESWAMTYRCNSG